MDSSVQCHSCWGDQVLHCCSAGTTQPRSCRCALVKSLVVWVNATPSCCPRSSCWKLALPKWQCAWCWICKGPLTFKVCMRLIKTQCRFTGGQGPYLLANRPMTQPCTARSPAAAAAAVSLAAVIGALREEMLLPFVIYLVIYIVFGSHLLCPTCTSDKQNTIQEASLHALYAAIALIPTAVSCPDTSSKPTGPSVSGLQDGDTGQSRANDGMSIVTTVLQCSCRWVICRWHDLFGIDSCISTWEDSVYVACTC